MKTLLSIPITIIFFTGFLWSQEPGLIAHYPFRGNANDASGNGHHGVVYGATLTIDRFGNPNNAYHFDGIDDHIDVPYDSSFYPASFCAAVWVNVTSLPDTGHSYILTNSGDQRTPPYDPFRLRVDSLGQIYSRFEGDRDSIHIRLDSETLLNAAEWYFIVTYYDHLSGKGALYIDAIKEDSVDLFMALDTNSIGFMMGARQVHNGNTGDDQFFNGSIDDIRLYNRALSDTEILSLYNEVVGIEPDKDSPADKFVLYQNYPNPFNPGTVIEYQLAKASEVRLTVLNLLGERVRELVHTSQQAGIHRVSWDGCDNQGREVAGGVYLYQLQAGAFRQTQKMVLLR